MIIAAFVTLVLIAMYIACAYPSWFWTIYLVGPSILSLVLVFTTQGYNPSAIAFGPLVLRATDPGVLGLLVGVLYHGRHRGLRLLRNRPGGFALGLILLFFVIKIAWTVLLANDQISANAIVSHAAGGLVAAVGDLRDNLFSLIAPLYAYVVRRSCDQERLGWPLITASAIIMLKGLLAIIVLGRVWSDTADFRFIDAQDAIALTIISIILLFVPVRGISTVLRRSYGAVILIFGLVANHRSQWAGSIAAVGVLAAIILFGRPLLGGAKMMRIALSAMLLFCAITLATISSVDTLQQRSPLLGTLTVRLYALTDPRRDADSKWRERLWQDRISQQGADWPWGRIMGDRRATLYEGKWLDVPDHSAYVSMYELGGVILCVLFVSFWGAIIQIAVRRLMDFTNERMAQTGAMTLSIAAATLAFGGAYDFPMLGPALAVALTLSL